MKIHASSCWFLVLAVLAPLSAGAQTLVFDSNGLSGSVMHSPPDLEGDPGSDDEQGLNFPNYSYNMAVNNQLQFTLTAPAGEMFVVNWSSALVSPSLDFKYYYGATIDFPIAGITSTSYAFNFVQGSSADVGTIQDETLIGTNSGVEPGTMVPVTGNFAFTSFTANIGYDNTSVSLGSLPAFSFANLQYNYQNTSDPGQQLFVTAVPVPEPATEAWIGAVGLLAFGSAVWRKKQKKSPAF